MPRHSQKGWKNVRTSLHHIQTTKTTKDNIKQLLFCSIVPCCLLLFYVVWFFNANYHELSINCLFAEIHGQLYGNYMFCYYRATILCKSNQFFHLFFSALALFPPFWFFFLSEAFFYYLLYWETPQWDVSTSLHSFKQQKQQRTT